MMVPGHNPAARWVLPTPHRSHPAGHPPNRQPAIAREEERGRRERHSAEADDDEDGPQGQPAASRFIASVALYSGPKPPTPSLCVCMCVCARTRVRACVRACVCVQNSQK